MFSWVDRKFESQCSDSLEAQERATCYRLAGKLNKAQRFDRLAERIYEMSIIEYLESQNAIARLLAT